MPSDLAPPAEASCSRMRGADRRPPVQACSVWFYSIRGMIGMGTESKQDAKGAGERVVARPGRHASVLKIIMWNPLIALCCIAFLSLAAFLQTVEVPAQGGGSYAIRNAYILQKQDGRLIAMFLGPEDDEDVWRTAKEIAGACMTVSFEYEGGVSGRWPLPTHRYQRTSARVWWLPENIPASEMMIRNGVSAIEVLETYIRDLPPGQWSNLKRNMGRYGAVRLELPVKLGVTEHNRMIWWPGVRYNIARVGWVVSAGAGVLCLLAWGVGARRRWLTMRRTRGHRCERCDYDLTGITSGRCPECGTPIAPPEKPPEKGSGVIS